MRLTKNGTSLNLTVHQISRCSCAVRYVGQTPKGILAEFSNRTAQRMTASQRANKFSFQKTLDARLGACLVFDESKMDLACRRNFSKLSTQEVDTILRVHVKIS